ncbi:Lambda-carrageenase [Pontiella desulfatans]|uniref:Lambda-carrageenase n=1 Tax=Pontiella desulfatans TaxID=2750659 RepID=A0A6C2UC68_PONDE|nr:PQQ-binding-like beta-propeller repeat protein [Pontiella desulfatans]VGO17782.1 Lambda-carrageenase [Pontiella desulfatans]
MKTLLLMVALLCAFGVLAKDFETAGNGIRNLVPGTVKGTPVLFVSEIDGAVSCYKADGSLLWRNPSEDPAVMFEIEAVDLDADGRDDLLAASGDGHIHCWNADGTLKWKFNPGHKVRFSEVAVVGTGQRAQIFAGGNDSTLYELDATGKLRSETPIDGVVRKIEAGHFLNRNKPSLFVMTYSHDKFRWEFMGLLDPETKKVQRQLDGKNPPSKDWGTLMVTDLSVADLDRDGLDDLLFFGSSKDGLGTFIALDAGFREQAKQVGSRKHKQRYAHVQGQCLLPVREEVAFQYGGVLYVCDLKGNLIETTGEKYRGLLFNDFALEPVTGTLFAGGQIGGGNTVYSYPLKGDGWWKAEHVLRGRLAEVERNLETLYRQALDFKPPTYQQPAKKEWVMITGVDELPEVARLDAAKITFVQQVGMQENTDRAELVAAMGEEALKRDKRMGYDQTREEIVALARELEKNGEPFVAWAGHGNDPFITQIDTMEQVLEVAPNTCYGFIYAEMHDIHDPRVHHFINEYVPRLAKACRKHGRAKLYFRYKNVFWAASSHQEPWKDLFFSGKYNDILVPSAEDTNSRTQDINFTGRVGMLVAGYIDDFATRLVDDNPTSWRPLSPGGQRSVSPYLRNGALLAAYGARYGILFGIGYLEDPGMNILFALMKSGVLPVVDKEDILSISSWHLIQEADEDHIHTIDDGHNMKTYSKENEDAVLSVAQVAWCGASLPDHDYSKQALGVAYRWLNFLPEMPNGLVPIVPVEYAPKLIERKTPFTVSDTKVGFVDGEKVSAKAFGPLIGNAAREGAAKMPVVVKGASWSAIRLDAKHIRVVLIDPGYIDPQERAATIHFNGKAPASALDILSGENLSVDGASTQLTVPAGSMRFIDLSY